MCGLPAVNFMHKALEQDPKFPNDTPLHRIAVVSSSRLINTCIELMTDNRRRSPCRYKPQNAQNSALETSLIY